MACNRNNLSALAYANGFTLWHYKTPDRLPEVMAQGYFNAVSDMLRVGDFVNTNVDIGNEVRSGVLVVESNAERVVRVGMVDF